MAFTDYTPSPAGSGGGTPAAAPKGQEQYLSHSKLKKQYLDYLSTKRDEIDEQIQSRRYRHGAQYTNEQIEALRRRKQPVVTYNRISRKIDGVVGLVEKMRLDPKAYPRTPQHEQGAELATAVLRYVLDEQEWKAKSPIIAADAATEGIGGLEILLEQGDRGDVEVGFDLVDPDGFFYDPRSSRLDFSDARFMGVGKWVDIDQAKEMFPDKAEELDAALDGSDLTSNSDKDQKWFSSDGGRVRIVDHWYKHNGEWCFCIYTGSLKLMEGKSFLTDEKKKTICKYIMFSANVDQDGDRYGFVRQLRSAQDEVNARRSKGLHELNTRRIISERGAFDDIEEARREAARPDGIVIRNPGKEATFDDTHKATSLQGQVEFLQEAKNEIENFGPNPALIGQGIENKSGRAIQLLQQAGIAELGPYILAYRGWKLRVYRAVFNAVQNHWTGERWVRVTDEEEIAQFIQINGLQNDPITQRPQLVNAIGALDVDIILDEGADSVNMQADAYDTLTVLASKGANIPAPVLIELSPLQASVKKRMLELLEKGQQPSPEQQIMIAETQAKVIETQASAKLKEAQAAKALADAQKAIAEANAPQPVDTGPMEARAKIAMEMEKHQQEMHLRAEEAQAARERQAIEQQREHERHAMERQRESERHAIDMQTKQGEAVLSRRRAAIDEQDKAAKIALTRSQAEKARTEARIAAQPKSKEPEKQADQATLVALSAVADALKKLSGPKRIVRGKDGRAESVEPV